MRIQFPVQAGFVIVSLILCRYAQAVQFDAVMDSNLDHEASLLMAYKVIKGTGVLTNKYLIATFPHIRKVVYAHLPDNVWRPMITGDLERPGAVAIDHPERRLYIADEGMGKIWRYSLKVGKDGTLQTSRERYIVSEGYIASWMSVDYCGDLYFTGQRFGSNQSHNTVFRLEKRHINSGLPYEPAELKDGVRQTANLSHGATASGARGIATDNFNIYWGRTGTAEGSICKGTHKNAGTQKADMKITALTTNVYDVHGMAVTGNYVFWTSEKGVHGIGKSSEIADEGLVAAAPNQRPWNPKNLAWDVDNTLYLVDTMNEAVYMVPAANTRLHNLTKFNDAPGIDNIAIFQSGTMQIRVMLMPVLVAFVAVLTALMG